MRTQWKAACGLLAILPVLLFAAGCDEDGITGPDLNVSYTQVDRFGLPAIATVFIPTSKKDSYNQAQPAGDRANFKTEVLKVLIGFGQSSNEANQLADALLPDIQPINTAASTAFLNGRKPSDDVITAELKLIFGSNTSLNDDHVDANDKAFPSSFPYLAAPST